MPRTLDPAAHAVRRDTFVDAAQRLITVKGYEEMSIQDVLAATGASKGAFYHYFDSKAALLDAVVERMVEQASVVVAPILEDPDAAGPGQAPHALQLHGALEVGALGPRAPAAQGLDGGRERDRAREVPTPRRHLDDPRLRGDRGAGSRGGDLPRGGVPGAHRAHPA